MKISQTFNPKYRKSLVKRQQGGNFNFLDYQRSPLYSYLDVSKFQTNQPEPIKYSESVNYSEEVNDLETIPTNSEDMNEEVIETSEEKPIDVKVFDPNYGLMQEFIDKANEENLPFRITSGYRPGAMTSKGTASWHSKGLALDIVPSQGVSWDTFRSKLKNSTKLLEWMRNNKFGILDETSPEMLRKTGGTGAHFHIGKDLAAIDNFKRMFPKAQEGIKVQGMWGKPITGEYVVPQGSNLNEISQHLNVPTDSLISYNNIVDPNKINVGQTIKWRKSPTFKDNIARFFFESPEKSEVSRNVDTAINENVAKSKKVLKEVDTTPLKEEFSRKYNEKTNWDNVEAAFNFFKDNGLSYLKNITAVANIIKESGGDPNAIQMGGGPGRHLMQWEKDTPRYKHMQDFGRDEKDELTRQLKYILHTISTPDTQNSWTFNDRYNRAIKAYEAFDTADNLEDLNYIFLNSYVRPKERKQNYINRLNMSKDLLKIFKQY